MACIILFALTLTLRYAFGDPGYTCLQMEEAPQAYQSVLLGIGSESEKKARQVPKRGDGCIVAIDRGCCQGGKGSTAVSSCRVPVLCFVHTGWHSEQPVWVLRLVYKCRYHHPEVPHLRLCISSICTMCTTLVLGGGGGELGGPIRRASHSRSYDIRTDSRFCSYW